MANSLDTSALDGYYREHKEEIWAQNFVPADAYKHLTVMTDVRDEAILTSLEMGTMVVGHANAFNPPTNADVLSQRTLKVRPLKTERRYAPQDLRKEWLAKLQLPGFSQANLPFEKFFFEKILGKIKEELELQAIAKGVGSWPTLPTSAAQAYDGYLKIIADEIVATSLTPIVTGAITGSNAIDSLELVYDGASARLKSTPSKMYMSYEVYNFYIREYRGSFGPNVTNTTIEKTFLDGTMGLCELVPLRAWGASQRLLLTTQENMVLGIDAESDFANINSEMVKRNLEIWVDYQQSVQIRTVNDETIAVNDQV